MRKLPSGVMLIESDSAVSLTILKFDINDKTAMKIRMKTSFEEEKDATGATNDGGPALATSCISSTRGRLGQQVSLSPYYEHGLTNSSKT
jgi:hypothetical protein